MTSSWLFYLFMISPGDTHKCRLLKLSTNYPIGTIDTAVTLTIANSFRVVSIKARSVWRWSRFIWGIQSRKSLDVGRRNFFETPTPKFAGSSSGSQTRMSMTKYGSLALMKKLQPLIRLMTMKVLGAPVVWWIDSEKLRLQYGKR